MPGAWDIVVQPQDGKTCVALVTREDGTREDIGQQLPQTLKPAPVILLVSTCAMRRNTWATITRCACVFGAEPGIGKNSC